MKPAIKSMEVEAELFDENFHPDDINEFNFLLRLMAGPPNEEGEESFDVEVCSIEWLKNNMPDDALIGRHKIILKEYNYKLIREKINKIIDLCHGENWSETARKLSRYAYWEFEDYRE